MQPILHTLGYEGSTIDDVLVTLEAAGIACVLDVREVPISRKAGFSKSALSSKLEARGISYVHLKGLGDPKAGRIAAREGRFEDFRQLFHAHLKTEKAQTDLARALELASKMPVCLLCFERDPSNCHRLILATEMTRQKNFTLVNIKTKSRIVDISPKRYLRSYEQSNAKCG